MTDDAVIRHYDRLIDIDNDPVRDPEPLKQYMDTWDGQDFINKMELSGNESVLEIGVGTGRLAVRTAPLCAAFFGIDLSPKTIGRAKENLNFLHNVTLICSDFLTYKFRERFDVIYSSLTFMHIKEKQTALNKISDLLIRSGKFLLSIDKNQDSYIDVGISKIKVYPDDRMETRRLIENAGLWLAEEYETESAYVFICEKGEPAFSR